MEDPLFSSHQVNLHAYILPVLIQSLFIREASPQLQLPETLARTFELEMKRTALQLEPSLKEMQLSQ
jgi:hypothetical protein